MCESVSHGLFSHADVQMRQHTDRKGWGDDVEFQVCVMLTATDDAVTFVTANLVSGQLFRPEAKFGSERESYKSLTDTFSSDSHALAYTQKTNDRSHLYRLRDFI